MGAAPTQYVKGVMHFPLLRFSISFVFLFLFLFLFLSSPCPTGPEGMHISSLLFYMSVYIFYIPLVSIPNLIYRVLILSPTRNGSWLDFFEPMSYLISNPSFPWFSSSKQPCVPSLSTEFRALICVQMPHLSSKAFRATSSTAKRLSMFLKS